MVELQTKKCNKCMSTNIREEVRTKLIVYTCRGCGKYLGSKNIFQLWFGKYKDMEISDVAKIDIEYLRSLPNSNTWYILPLKFRDEINKYIPNKTELIDGEEIPVSLVVFKKIAMELQKCTDNPAYFAKKYMSTELSIKEKAIVKSFIK
jgi:Cdc6-like AAA superfamily ATPase